jgi:hypothetical protein
LLEAPNRQLSAAAFVTAVEALHLEPPTNALAAATVAMRSVSWGFPS